MPRTAIMTDVGPSVAAAARLSRHGRFPAVDFSLPSLRGDNREVALILGFSLAMTILLAGIAFGSVSLIFKLL